jgi:hypothetical protein
MISKLINGLFVLIGYVCTATVLTAVVGILYLWKTDRLNDEKMFRMVALFHDIDLHELAEAQRKTADEVPPEEASLEEGLRRQQVMDRHFEIKLLALRKGRQEYDQRWQQINSLIERQDRMTQDFQTRLAEQEELKSQENLATVVGHLEMLQPSQAKEELIRWIDEDRMNDAILLMSKMSEKKLRSILKSFQTPKELTTLYQIHQRIIDSHDKASTVKDALEELNAER